MRNFITVVFAIMMLFSSSCAMKKVALRFLDIQHSVPTKALPSGLEYSSSALNIWQLCSLKTKTGSAWNDVELASTVEALQLSTPVLLLLSAFVFAWIAFRLIPLSIPRYLTDTAFFSSTPLYLQFRRLVYYG